MEAFNNFIYFATLLWLTATSAQDVEEPPPVITTENFQFPTQETTEKPFEESTTLPSAIEGKEEEPFPVEERPVVVAFPENHKNFTPSQYLGGEEEFPPYYNHLNTYQQQYKNYYEQKQLYNRKPLKFEENSLKNFYLPSGTDSTGSGSEKKNEGFRGYPNPFPYAFETERGQENRYKNTGHALLHEQPTIEGPFRGHQESIAPYYVYPHGYLQDVKFHEVDPLHLDHHHPVRKDDKGSPWKKVFHVLTALVPLGLLLATLTPNVISINSTATGKASRRRSEDSSPPLRFKEEDVVRLLRKHGVDSLGEMQCEDRVICELAREGGKSGAGAIEKGFWFLANQTPWNTAEKAGMNELFKAIRSGNCEVFKCHSKKKLGRNSTRKHKAPEEEKPPVRGGP